MYPYESVQNVHSKLLDTLDIEPELLHQLAYEMFRADLDPRFCADVAKGLELCGLCPADYGL